MESAANIVAMAVYVGKIDAKLDQLLTEVRDVQNQLKIYRKLVTGHQ